ncbi:MAG: hypothetical protein WD157_01345, partial [Patescibacteria group bacterium]
MIKKIFVFALGLVFLTGLLSTSQVKAQTDDWSPVSSVGMTVINDQRYYNNSSSWRLDNYACFGTWGRNNAKSLGGTFACAGDGTTVGSTAFDFPPNSEPVGEQFTAGIKFSSNNIYSVANYDLDSAGVNA